MDRSCPHLVRSILINLHATPCAISSIAYCSHPDIHSGANPRDVERDGRGPWEADEGQRLGEISAKKPGLGKSIWSWSLEKN